MKSPLAPLLTLHEGTLFERSLLTQILARQDRGYWSDALGTLPDASSLRFICYRHCMSAAASGHLIPASRHYRVDFWMAHTTRLPGPLRRRSHHALVHTQARMLGATTIEERIPLKPPAAYSAAAALQQIRAGALHHPSLSWRLEAGARVVSSCADEVVVRWTLPGV